MDFSGQTVAVTGASRGIGRAIALAFGRRGARVACVATTVDGAGKTAQAIQEAGGAAEAYACDIASAQSVESFVEAVVERSGAPSVLVNNAGITADNLMMRMKDEDWERVLRVNLTGAFLLTRAMSRPMMKARYGRIVNISSVIGLHGGAGQANYAAAKAGLVGLTLSVAKELGSRGITCNAVAPGFIETDMTENLPEDFRAHVLKTAPAGRLGTPDDVAAAVLFLASPEAAYITGQTLTVDGGLYL